MIKRKETALLNPSNYLSWDRELWNDRDCVLAAVRVNGNALANANTRLRADREVVLAAVKESGRALQYAHDYLRADREVVLAAVQEKGNALLHASKDLCADREVVLTAVQQCGDALQYASKELRADREVVLATVQQKGDALLYASKDLRADREVVLTAVQQCGRALVYASNELRADREIVLAAVQQAGWALQYVDETLRQDEQFVAELADVCPLGYMWFYEPQLSLEKTARKAVRSERGLLLLARQARVSLLGEPAMMKELLLSAVEHGCLKDALRMLIASQKKGVLTALRTVMAWYGLDVPTDALVGLLSDSESEEMFCTSISSALAGARA